jgi:uncharacterized protein with NAD-binding domain and iron-sulfur cluster
LNLGVRVVASLAGSAMKEVPSKVVILGDGIAGMSAAHELIGRGLNVDIYDELRIPGGKARSIPVYPDVHGDRQVFEISLERWFHSEKVRLDPHARRAWLPGEHGFRFLPGQRKLRIRQD